MIVHKCMQRSLTKIYKVFSVNIYGKKKNAPQAKIFTIGLHQNTRKELSLESPRYRGDSPKNPPTGGI